jgi:transcription elongation GreA/GreB family factor
MDEAVAISLKQQLHQYCKAFVQARLDNAQAAISSAQQAANDETKSSAGDKYETTRALMQQETSRNMVQLNEASKLMATLNMINPGQRFATAQLGSLVLTSQAVFYIAVSAGVLQHNGHTYMAVSLASPIGQQINGKAPGGHFSLNGKQYLVEAVY